MTYWTNIPSHPNPKETEFLAVIQRVLNQPSRPDRTGVGTRSLFNVNLSFSLSENQFPLMTTRRLIPRMVFEELMWILRGQTDNSILQLKKIHVWDANTNREFLDTHDLHHLPIGDVGESYGFLMRHFGAEYIDCKTDYIDQGYDQLAELVGLLKTDPTNRRLILNLWNPARMRNMALPPCLFNYQFYVDTSSTPFRLSCKMTQRSSDISLAGGWNICTGALLVNMLALVCEMEPFELYWSVGDCHIYQNQIETTQEQLRRTPYAFPKLFITQLPEGETPLDKLLNFEWSDFFVRNYVSHPPIKFQMNA